MPNDLYVRMNTANSAVPVLHRGCVFQPIEHRTEPYEAAGDKDGVGRILFRVKESDRSMPLIGA